MKMSYTGAQRKRGAYSLTAREYLNQAYIIDRRINITLAKADRMKKSLYGRGQQLNDISLKSGNSNDAVGKTIAKVMEYEEKANELIDKLITARLEIESVIQLVSDDIQREILERRYLLFQQWDSGYDKATGDYKKGIYDSMNFSRRQIFRLHKDALRSVALNGIEWHSYID